MHSEKVIKIKRIGNIRTIDIEVNNNSHTFYANGGIVTSNSHAACYGLNSYWTAFCKAHFPAQFYCSYLEGAKWKQKPLQEVYELVNDMKLNNIDIAIPDFRDMQSINYIKNNTVYFSLGNIKGIGEAALTKIKREVVVVEELIGKKLNQWTWLDFLLYLSSRISSTSTQALILSGSLDYLGLSRSAMLYEYQAWNKLSDKEQGWAQAIYPTPNGKWYGVIDMVRQSCKLKRDGGACHDKRRVATVTSILHTLEHPPHIITDTADFIAWHEEHLLGAPVTCHRVDSCVDASHANTTCKEIIEGRHGYLMLAVEIASVRELVTKRGKTPGKKMAVLSVSDASCSLDNTVVFPEAWSEYGAKLYEGNTVLLQGERDNKQGSFIVKKVWQI